MLSPNVLLSVFSRFAIGLVLIAGCPDPANAQPQVSPWGAVRIGAMVAQPGQIVYGNLDVPPGTDSGVRISLVVIRGRSPGPTIALISGLHGGEFAGTVALQRVIRQIDPERLSGTVLVAPLVNVNAFEQLTPRVNPTDGVNMNRAFPGKADGTQTQRVACVLTRELLAASDYVIDYHGGDLNEDQHPYAYWVRTGRPDIDEPERRMLRAFGAPYLIDFPAVGLSPAKAHLLPTQAVALGRPTITVDAGRAGTYSEADIVLLAGGTLRVLTELGMLPGHVEPQPEPIHIQSTVYVNAPVSGIFFPSVSRGEAVRAEQEIGRITDIFGRPAATIVAPVSGVILYLNSTPSSVAGEQLFYIGIPRPAEPSQ